MSLVKADLDVMMLRGLHDHLQGGFFRYCVDQMWTIPHFEKMLYDQAMMLSGIQPWLQDFPETNPIKPLSKTISCLEDTFEDNGLYWAGHDADTDISEDESLQGDINLLGGAEFDGDGDLGEGATYLWGREELLNYLTKAEFDAFEKVYAVSEEGNFGGKNHASK